MAKIYFMHPFGICDENQGVFLLSSEQQYFLFVGFHFFEGLRSTCQCAVGPQSARASQEHARPLLGSWLGSAPVCLWGIYHTVFSDKGRIALVCCEDLRVPLYSHSGKGVVCYTPSFPAALFLS